MAPPAEKKKKHSSAEHHLSSSAAIGGKQQQPLGSLMTSFGRRRSLRVAKKMNRILRKIWICADVLMDIFPFFDRPQLGLKLALLSPRFDVLIDKHFGGKSELTIWRTIRIHKDIGMPKPKLSVVTNYVNFAPFPFPDYPLPINIRFNRLEIAYIDHSVLAFLRSNKQIFDGKGTKLDLHVYSYKPKEAQRIWNVFVREIWPIFAQNIRHLGFAGGAHLVNLIRRTSPSILTDLNQLDSIRSGSLSPDAIGGDFDGPNPTSAVQALSKWLHIPTKNGQPKRLLCTVYKASLSENLIKYFKEAFLGATTSVNFIIHFKLSKSKKPIETFELVNNRTNEKLALVKKDYHGYSDFAGWLLKRCQIGQMVQWEDGNSNNLNNVNFSLHVDCIGRLSPRKVGQMNAKNRLKMNPVPSGRKSERIIEKSKK